ncbi:hypothetical protein METBIDRAFT_9451 [Metschnikowia bicuspidata var. bicuspidata NRRL YB-4993]|uniref:LicD/FKTN/FKRP nucleotidyltransferase domain-containing protein n=1 Tax=Metschnikowia bicuspidata var. bicuspidata NRRL YB-4993 TaxID=869754 RepID=A0A1A0HH23_9ASCO|nr:hypothetical protein METBIDRAFT_9451 [Metschnikowia bicuspidata var. bicuspidata NRRL YB-4993]OBA23148.1 hypothetical protein METBIDRAFT_9451 [Metschnikowia bicuspidata var. bicuspidata NRRL YB-4993]
MTSIRRSRCVYIAALTALAYLIIFCVISYNGMTTQLFSAKLKEFSLDSPGLRSLFDVQDSYSLDAWADAIFRRKVSDRPADDAIRMARYSIDGPSESSDLVEVPGFLRGEGENPHLTPHEPRLTLGLLLSELNANLAGQHTLETLRIPSFHWADWTDLALLDTKMLSVKDSPATCELLNPTRKERNLMQKDIALDASRFCFNDADLAAAMQEHADNPFLAPYLQKIADLPYKAGLHVHQFPNRTSQRIRAIAAASYVHDFMPAPLAVHLLLPKGAQQMAPLHVPVNQDVSGRIRMADTPQARAVAGRSPVLDIRRELSSLAAHVDNSSLPAWKYRKELAHEAFVDTLASIMEQLAQQPNLSPQESNYLDSLRLSVGTKTPTKYFNEALLVRNEPEWASGSHYDWRFFKGLQSAQDEHAVLLHGLILAWLRFTNANDITSWIAHGSLLGWYWNGLSFPWDADYDVQVPIRDLHTLSRKFNQTVVVDFGALASQEVRLGRYFLDCGTWVSHRDRGNGLNNIDARFIDMDSGLYIDITALAVSLTATPRRYYGQLPKEFQKTNFVQKVKADPDFGLRQNTAAQLYNCRNKHFMSLAEISPLRLTMMEGVPAYIPNEFSKILDVEYTRGIDSKRFKSYAFLPRLRLWASYKAIHKYTRGRSANDKKIQMGGHSKIARETVDTLSVFSFNDQDYLELMYLEQDLLFEYLVTKETTLFHQKEMDLLLQGQSAETLLFPNGELVAPAQLRHDLNNYNAVKVQSGFGERMGEYMSMAQALKTGKANQAGRMNPYKDRPEEGDRTVQGPPKEDGQLEGPPNEALKNLPLLSQSDE